MNATEERLGKIAAKMTLREPFIATVYTRLDRIVDDESGIYAWTDGARVAYNTEFVAQLTDDELLWVGLHEALHVVLMHSWRRDGRDPALFNKATDAIINKTLDVMGYSFPHEKFGTVWIGWVTEEMSAEEVYARLMREQGNKPSQGKPDAGGFHGQGDLQDAPAGSSPTDVEASIITAARMAKACGSGSALIDRVLGGALQPTQSWVDLARHLARSAVRDDYCYKRFNRRMYGRLGVVMPTLYSEAMAGVAVLFDVSGSVSPEEANQIAAEVTAFAEDLNPEFVQVVYCTDEVTGTERFARGEPIDLHPRGCGGTRFKPAFDWLEQSGDQYDMVIYFTDLCGNVSECEDPGVPVLWGCTFPRNKDTPVPFGTVVEVHV